MDDIIFRSTIGEYCKTFEELMNSEFEMSMMGELTFFLGLQVNQTAECTFINQSNMSPTFFFKYKLSDASTMRTPMSRGTKLFTYPDGKSVE